MRGKACNKIIIMTMMKKMMMTESSFSFAPFKIMTRLCLPCTLHCLFTKQTKWVKYKEKVEGSKILLFKRNGSSVQCLHVHVDDHHQHQEERILIKYYSLTNSFSVRKTIIMWAGFIYWLWPSLCALHLNSHRHTHSVM